MTAPTPPRDAATRFLRALGRGAFADAAALVSPAVPDGAMAEPRLALLWGRLAAQVGDLEELAPPEEAPNGARVASDFAARFARAELTLRVVHDATGVVGFWVTPPRPPAYEAPRYVDPTRFREEELGLGAPPPLGATLTLPATGTGWPAVVLVHGSGPSDRDERLGGNRPFRDIAWGLATRGIAALRYDKRTFAQPGALAGGDATIDAESLDDAVAAIAIARTVPGIDPARVFVVGHSLGATFAPEIARREPAVAGVVLLAPTGRSVALALEGQIDHLESLAAAAGEPPEALATARALVRGLGARELPPDADALGASARYWYDLDDRRPLDVARGLRVPALALFGGRDYQVTAADAALWREALAGLPDAEVTELPTLDHLFREGEGIATPADYLARTGHVAEEVIERVATWIRRRSAAAGTG